ncbi:hypothetical protein Tco_0447600, partial [Tanacetum coccineum]
RDASTLRLRGEAFYGAFYWAFEEKARGFEEKAEGLLRTQQRLDSVSVLGEGW